MQSQERLFYMTEQSTKQENRIKKLRLKIILSDPFFGALLMRLPMIEDPNIPTFCTNGKYIKYNPCFSESISDEELSAVLVHEVMHCALGHPFRRNNRHTFYWNVAADFAINNYLKEYFDCSSVRYKLPKGALVNKKYKGKAAEEIYSLITKDKCLNPEYGNAAIVDTYSNSGYKNGKGEIPKPGEFTLEGWVEDCPGSDSERLDAEAEIKAAVSLALKEAEKQGKLPASLERAVGKLLRPSIHWAEALRQFVHQKCRIDYNWLKPNHKYLPYGFLFPSIDGEQTGVIAVAIDTSGSINQNDLTKFLSEVQSIVDDCNPIKLTVIYADCEVQHVDEFTPGDKITPKAIGGGGTDFKPAIEYACKMEETPECIIYFTDGEGYYGNAPSIPILWVMTTDKKAPFGETIKFID